MASKKNNLASVQPEFDASAKGQDVELEVEKLKNKYLLNALS